MEIHFDGATIHLPVVKDKTWKMGVEASYAQFVLRKLGDTSKELGCVKALINSIPPSLVVVEAMSGIGLSTKLFINNWRSQVIINDLSNECYNILKMNYPEYKVYNMNGLQLIEQEITIEDDKLLWVDFNNFSYKTRENYRPWFEHKGNKMIFTDSSIYGLTRYGGANFKTYGVKDIKGYFRLLNKWLNSLGWNINKISHFNNASFLYIDRNFNAPLSFVEGQPIPIVIDTPTPFSLLEDF